MPESSFLGEISL